MKNIDDLLIEEIKNDRLIEFDFIKSYINDYVKKNKLSRYYNQTIPYVPKYLLDCNLISAYDTKTKNVFMDDDRLKNSIIQTTYLKDKEAFDDNDMIFIYALYLNYITHELTHIKQNKLIHSFDNNPETRLIKDSFFVHDKYRDFYLRSHKYFISEQNAKTEASFKVLDLLNRTNLLKSKTILNEYNSFISAQIIGAYKDIGNFIVCPASVFYSNFKEKDCFFTLDKEMSKSNFERILYGMPFDKDLYYQLKQIKDKKIEVPNIKKMILRSGDYGKIS